MPLFHHSRKQFSFRETWIGEIGIAAILVLAEGIMGTGIMAMELENWICDMANGDKEGLRQFYEETARSVYSFIFSVLKDPHESEDVMQETFLASDECLGTERSHFADSFFSHFIVIGERKHNTEIGRASCRERV